MKLSDGVSLGAGDGPTDGDGEGAELGAIVGAIVVGVWLGDGDGRSDGEAEGAGLGALVGGVLVEGDKLGCADGADVGASVSNLQSFPSVMRNGPIWSPAYSGTLHDSVIVHVVETPDRLNVVLSLKGPTTSKESPSFT